MLSTNDVNKAYQYFCMPSSWMISKEQDRINKFFNTLIIESELVAKSYNAEFDVSYGVGENEKIDFIYLGKAEVNQERMPIVVFIHGGYWEEGSRPMHRCFAKLFSNQHGLIVAILGYDLCSATIKLPYIEEQCGKAVGFIHQKFPFSKLTVVGHSAGGYLATAMLTHKNLSDCIRGVVVLAGFGDVKFLTESSISKALVFDKLEDQNLLKRKFLLNESHNVLLLNAHRDSPLILTESLKLFEKLRKEYPEISVKLEVLENEDHFTMILNLLEPGSYISKCILNMVYGEDEK